MKNKHSGCQDGDRCTGPGCKVKTGKTRRNRLPAEQRPLTAREEELRAELIKKLNAKRFAQIAAAATKKEDK